jgi:hypothetical protein
MLGWPPPARLRSVGVRSTRLAKASSAIDCPGRSTILGPLFSPGASARGLEERTMLKDNVKKMFELGEEQVGKIAQQLLSNEKFVGAMQSVVGNSLKAKGLVDKNIRLALSAMNLPSVADLDSLRHKLEELEETIKRLEESVAKVAK